MALEVAIATVQVKVMVEVAAAGVAMVSLPMRYLGTASVELQDMPNELMVALGPVHDRGSFNIYITDKLILLFLFLMHSAQV